ncbi:hypothetical protein ENSA5_48160 [Enhygromyxa salina]|uniref:Flagellar assembly protein H n=1 Tax=Enhygromyxa salina TaxID=215803 RepID=A0A2S9XID4_9BACT|nr:hypothetical protein [Enhygromyxa salina]PRP92634.1 hypothetical protein ENSA5_48160 [Enhygromyxa salina]
MPGKTHQNIRRLFRKFPDRVLAYAREAGARLELDHDLIHEISGEFDDPLGSSEPVRADLVIVGRNEGRPEGAIVLEIQKDKDPNKAWTMILYRAAVRRLLKCPAWNLVFSPDPEVLRWVREDLFQLEPELTPFVITPEMIPAIIDLESALADIPAAVLGVVMHGGDPEAVVSAAVTLQALFSIRPSDLGNYLQLVSASISEEVMQQARSHLSEEDDEELSEWERRSGAFTKGLREGREAGQREGRREGREEGREEGQRDALRAVLANILEARGIGLDELTRTRIHACESLEDLKALVVRASTITTLDQLFVTPN